jgi:hypothetical protein
MLATTPVPTQTPSHQVTGAQSVSTAEPQSFQRPDNIFGLLSDLTRHPRQSVTLIILIGSILVIATLCVAGGVWVVMEATKGLKVGALPAVLTGIPGASLVAILASRIMRWFKKPGKDGKDSPSSG